MILFYFTVVFQFLCSVIISLLNIYTNWECFLIFTKKAFFVIFKNSSRLKMSKTDLRRARERDSVFFHSVLCLNFQFWVFNIHESKPQKLLILLTVLQRSHFCHFILLIRLRLKKYFYLKVRNSHSALHSFSLLSEEIKFLSLL